MTVASLITDAPGSAVASGPVPRAIGAFRVRQGSRAALFGAAMMLAAGLA